MIRQREPHFVVDSQESFVHCFLKRKIVPPPSRLLHSASASIMLARARMFATPRPEFFTLARIKTAPVVFDSQFKCVRGRNARAHLNVPARLRGGKYCSKPPARCDRSESACSATDSVSHPEHRHKQIRKSNLQSGGACSTACAKANCKAADKPTFSSADGLRSSQMRRTSCEIDSISERRAPGAEGARFGRTSASRLTGS